MTCIVAVTDGVTIHAGADTAAGQGDEIYEIPEPKIFVRNSMLFGVCGSYRLAQILRFRSDLPRPGAGYTDLSSFLAAEFVPALKAAVETDGAAFPGPFFLGEKTGILAGYDGELGMIGSTLAVFSVARPYLTIGSGRTRAYGALHAMTQLGVPPDRRLVELALEAAADTTLTVRGPYQFLDLPSSGHRTVGNSLDPEAVSAGDKTGHHRVAV